VIRLDGKSANMAPMIWPLVPRWLKGRIAQVFDCQLSLRRSTGRFPRPWPGSRPFRNAWKRDQRCLVPFSWFYEWDQRSKPKQPWRILPVDQPFLVMAGLWERTPLPDGDILESFTIVTTGPNRLLTEIGHHRSPVMLERDQWNVWLHGSPSQAEGLIQPPADDLMTAHKVTTRVNNPGYQEDDLLEAI
jgi:putative SOS response-associated peptidase YedK